MLRRLARLRPRRLGLRARIRFSFALGAFLLSLLLAGFTYAFTRSALLDNRDRSAVTQAYRNSGPVQTTLRSDASSLPATLQTLGGANNSPLVFAQGAWTQFSSEFGPESLPQALRTRVVEQGTPARMLYRLNGKPVLGVGIPLPAVGASYFEIVSLAEVASTLRSVGVSLLVATAITTSLGLVLGSWAARRAVRPLRDAAQAANTIAGGRLDTRLETTDDRDLARLASSFNDMAAALQTRVERDARFASDVSHELRSPLTTLAASIEVLQARRDEMPEKAAAALDLLVADVARFQGLVEDLLEMSRFDARAVRLHLEDLGVAEFVRQAVAVSSLPEAPVKVDEATEEVVILADKRRLARVIANLIDNARLHGGGDAEISVTPPPVAEGDVAEVVWIAVEDHGPGIQPDERSLIFGRFARGAGSGRRSSAEGAGLGLALVEEHMRLHGGRVWVEDRTDAESGARFVIELPVAP